MHNERNEIKGGKCGEPAGQCSDSGSDALASESQASETAAPSYGPPGLCARWALHSHPTASWEKGLQVVRPQAGRAAAPPLHEQNVSISRWTSRGERRPSLSAAAPTALPSLRLVFEAEGHLMRKRSGACSERRRGAEREHPDSQGLTVSRRPVKSCHSSCRHQDSPQRGFEPQSLSTNSVLQQSTGTQTGLETPPPRPHTHPSQTGYFYVICNDIIETSFTFI